MVEYQFAKAVSYDVTLRAVYVRRRSELADVRIAVTGLTIPAGDPPK